jgi:acylphosphatase
MTSGSIDRRSVRIRVRGRVQGVGFRAWTAATALRLELDGWVRNRSDGSVEVFAAGTDSAVDALVEALRRGPRGARVDRVHVAEVADAVEPGFDQRPTA